MKKTRKKSSATFGYELTKLQQDIRRANKRLESLENAGLTEKSPAYLSMQGVNILSRKQNAPLMTENMQKGTIRFRTDIRRLKNTDTETLETLKAQVEAFLYNKTSMTANIRKRELYKQRVYEAYKKKEDKHFHSLYEAALKKPETEKNKKFIKEYEKTMKLVEDYEKQQGTSNKSFETLKGRRKARARRAKNLKWDISYEQWENIFDTILYEKLVKHFSSNEAVDIMVDVEEGKIKARDVEDYLLTLDKNESGNLGELLTWSAEGTPKEERTYL